MAANHIADSSFLVALLTERDRDHDWAVAQAARHPRPWKTCDAALSEGFYMLGSSGTGALAALIRRGSLVTAFDFGAHADNVLQLMTRYSNVPMAFADACLVRATLRSASLAGAYLVKANLVGVDLCGADLTFCVLVSCNLSGANLAHANLQAADLATAKFAGAILAAANITNTDLGLADLRRAQLAGADLQGADLSTTNLAGATFDAATRWPFRFDPKSHGARISSPVPSRR